MNIDACKRKKKNSQRFEKLKNLKLFEKSRKFFIFAQFLFSLLLKKTKIRFAINNTKFLGLIFL
jgi:hypothetical protein